MSEPTLQAPGLQDPYAAFWAQDPSILRPPATEDLEEHHSYAPLALALGGAFLAAVVYTARSAPKTAPEDPAPSMKRLVSTVFEPNFLQRAVPQLLLMYFEAGRNAPTMAAVHAESLGQMIGQASAEAVLGGYEAGLNQGQSSEVAWRRAVSGFGLTKRDMRTFLEVEGKDKTYREGLIGPQGANVLGRLLTRRADLIGRDEMFAATSVARLAGWMGDVAAGDLSPVAKKKWVTAHDEKVCTTCGPMHGRVKPLEEPFDLPNGAKLYAPLAHPNCRCVVELVNPRKVTITKAYTTKEGKLDERARDKNGHFATKDSRSHAVAGLLERAKVDYAKPAPAPVRAEPQIGAPVTEPQVTREPQIARPEPRVARAEPQFTARSEPQIGAAEPQIGKPEPQIGNAKAEPRIGAGEPQIGAPETKAVPHGKTRVVATYIVDGQPVTQTMDVPTENIGNQTQPLMRLGNDLIEWVKGSGRPEDDDRDSLTYSAGAYRPLVRIREAEDLEGQILDFDSVNPGGDPTVFGASTRVEAQLAINAWLAAHENEASRLGEGAVDRATRTISDDQVVELQRLSDDEMRELAVAATQDMKNYDLDDLVAEGEQDHGAGEMGYADWARNVLNDPPRTKADKAFLEALVTRFHHSDTGQELTWESTEMAVQQVQADLENLETLMANNPAIIMRMEDGWTGLSNPTQADEQGVMGKYRVTEVRRHHFGEDVQLPSSIVDNNRLMQDISRIGYFVEVFLSPISDQDIADWDEDQADEYGGPHE